MATIANLVVNLSLNDNSFQSKLQSSRDHLEKWGSSLRNLGTKFTAGVTAPLMGAGLLLTKWSANLEQTIGATEHLWGDNTDAIMSWAEAADKSMGMSVDEALTTANRLNGIYRGMGLSMDETQAKTEEMGERFADLSALMGGSPVEAAEAYTSALMGNYQALDKYNININAAMVEQRALTMTGKESTAQLTAEEKQLAFNALYLEKTADAQGQFHRELHTTSGRLAVNTARAKNAANTFGKLLLPYVNKLLEAFSKMVDWVEKLSDKQRTWVIGIAAVAAAIGPVLIVIGMLLPGLSALLGLLGLLISPIGAVVVGVGLLAAGLIYAYTHFETFREIVDKVASTVRDVAVAAFDAFLRAMQPVVEFVGTIIDVFVELKDAITSAFQGDWSGAWESLKSAASGAVDAIGQYFKLVPSMILSALGVGSLSELLAKGAEWAQGLWNGAKNLWDTTVSPWFAGLALSAVTAVGDVSSSLQQKGTDFIQGIYNAITVGWTTVSAWFANMKNLAFIATGDVTETLASKGRDIVSGFYEGVTTRWAAVRTWFINMPTMIFNAIGGVLETLRQKGIDIVAGFLHGTAWKWAFGGVKEWFVGLGGLIVGAVGDLSRILVQAGKDAIQGLINGVGSMIGSLKNKINEVIGIFQMIPGLGNSPWPMMIDASRDAMDGLMIGIDQRQRLLQRRIEGVAGQFADTDVDFLANANMPTFTPHNFERAGNGDGADRPIVIIQTPDPERWVEFLNDSKMAADFAKGFAGELGMSEGVA